MANGPFTLLIVSHVIHYEFEGKVYAYGPYAREIEVWAELFERILIASPLRRQVPPNDALAFAHPNIEMRPQAETGGDSAWEKIIQLLWLPLHLWKLGSAMMEADAIHVRCPGNIGLLGALLAPLFSRRIVAKYAGQWHGNDSIPATYRWQRSILSSWWWRFGIVTVYGEWPSQPPQVKPFFTSMMTASQMRVAREAATRKEFQIPVRLLYSGRLVPGKGLEVLLRAVRLVQDRGLDCQLTIVGDGPEGDSLKQLAAALKLDDEVTFSGAVPYDEVMAAYDRAHVLILASNSEGWPKVVAEAMCHGVVCICADNGLMPWMLHGRGLTVPVDNPTALAEALWQISHDPQQYRQLSLAAGEWAQQYSLDGLRDALGNMLAQSWQLPALRPSPPDVVSR